jgi:hypothetical protein
MDPVVLSLYLSLGDRRRGWHEGAALSRRRATVLASLASSPRPSHWAPAWHRNDLRHLTASRLLAEGLPLPTVAAQLRHANTAVTAAVYSHALRGSDQRVAQALERALGWGMLVKRFERMLA